MRAAEVLDSDAARIPWYDPRTGKGDRRRVVNLTGLPHFPEVSDAVVRVVIDLPPNSQAGPQVSDNLGTWGLHSAPAYRAMLNLAYLWYEPGRTHYPLETGYGPRWVPSHDPEQYEPVTNVDLIGLCYPNAVVSRNRHRQLERSLEALQQLEEAGEVVIVPVGTSGRERRILPPHFGDGFLRPGGYGRTASISALSPGMVRFPGNGRKNGVSSICDIGVRGAVVRWHRTTALGA